MDHVAIMNKSWGLLPKILSGEKTIESRWYKTKRAPWGKVKNGDRVYFKNSGELIALKAKVKKVENFDSLTPKKVGEILRKYGKKVGIERSGLDNYHQYFKNKKYCILIFFERVEKVVPFGVDKRGFGAMAAWITVKNIKSIKIAENKL